MKVTIENKKGLDKDVKVFIDKKTMNSYIDKKYEEKWVLMMKNKLGLIGYNNEDKGLILDLLTWMHQKKLDYTNTFLYLMNLDIEKNIDFNDYEFKNWKKRWEKRLSNNSHTDEKYTEIMKRNNPVVIPRNHIVENALNFANQGDLEPTVKLIDILSKPYVPQEDIKDYQQPSRSNEKYQTFCGT